MLCVGVDCGLDRILSGYEAMTWLSNEAISVLVFLFPGFLMAGIFNMLVSNPKPNGFGVIVQALVFTVLIHLVAQHVFWIGNTVGWIVSWSEIWAVLVLLVLSVVLGMALSYVWNIDFFHRCLRKLGLTRQSSYRSALYSAFAYHGDCFVVLHMKGRRRLYGWPQEWPSRTEDHHFLMIDCEWLTDDGRTPVTGVSHILVPSSEVEMVEFLRSETIEEADHGIEAGKDGKQIL